MRSPRARFLSSLGRELRDYHYDGPRIDWVALLLPASLGSLGGFLVSLTIEDGGNYLVATNTLLWAVIALGLMLAGTFMFHATITGGLAIVIGSELLREARRPHRERRDSIRNNLRHLKDSVVDGRIPLASIETVRATLRIRDESSERDGIGWYERRLVNRWRRQRDRIEALLETSWEQALPEAIEYLTQTARELRGTKPRTAGTEKDIEVAWYLARSPQDAGVRRLLCEYLPCERKAWKSPLEFRTGVVYTPYWVYDLVRDVENSRFSPFAGRWSFMTNRGDTIGSECAPIGDTDRETVEKLHEPRGDGPLKSIRETVETARRV